MKLSKSDAATYAALITVAIFEAWEPFRKEAATPPEAHPYLSSNLLNYIPIVLLTLVGIIWLLRQLFPLLEPAPRPRDRPVANSDDAKTTQISEVRKFGPVTEIPRVHDQYIDKRFSYFYLVPPNNELWNVSIKFNKSGEKLLIRLDYRYHSSGIGLGNWLGPKQVFVQRLDTFTKGTEQKITLARLDRGKPKRMWRWIIGDADRLYPSTHQCRLAFFIDDVLVDQFNFIIDIRDDDDKNDITFIGENRFSFAEEWPEGPVG
jgi:hypothetical protein